MEEHDQEFELDRMRFSELKVAPKAINHQQHFGYSMDELKLSEAHADHSEIPSSGHFNYLLDMLNNGSTADDKLRHINAHCNDQESTQGLDLPESPFAPPLGSGISTVT
ncbi:hypothetical protein U1Q18_024410 [Sarracenia purpurea var. burkii]